MTTIFKLILLITPIIPGLLIVGAAKNAVDLPPIFERLKNCILYLIQLTQPQDYSGIGSPYILKVYKLEIPGSNFNTHPTIPASVFQAEYIFKVRNLQCACHLILFDLPVSNNAKSDVQNLQRYFFRFNEDFKHSKM
ncbi:unnamed protein product, partial [Allacma fusca]